MLLLPLILLLFSFELNAGVLALPPVISGTVVVCEGQTTTLTASVVPANLSVTYRWYTAPTGGTLLFSGNPYTTPAVTGSYNLYVESVESGVPSLTRTIVSILMVNNVDVVSATATPANVCPGSSTTLTATSVAGNTNFEWYDAPTGGALLFTGNNYSPVISGTTTYYVCSIDANGCKSPRTPVVVIATPNLDIPVGSANPTAVCPDDNVALTGTSLNGSTIFKWYDAPSGGTLLYTGQVYNTSVSVTTIVYLETANSNGCASIRVPVNIVVVPNLDIPVATATPPVICPGQSVDLQGTSANGSTVFNWYDVPAGGAILYTGQTYTTTASNTSTFYLETFNTAGCPSTRTPVTVTVLPNTDIPVATANPTTVCPGDNVQLTGTSANGSSIFHWYDAPAAGNLLFTGSVYNTTVNNTTTFYLETENGTGCLSSRTPVTVFVTPNLDIPTATVNPTTPCPGSTVTMTAASVNGSTVFNWYDAATGGTLLFTGGVYSTIVATSTVFYLESQNTTGCKSIRTPVNVVVVPNTDVPVGTANPSTACPGDNIAITGTSINGSSVFNWYDAPSGGNLLFTGAVYNTTVNATTIFYLETSDANGCVSIRTPVTVTILPNLDVPVATATPPTVCPGQTVDLQGTSANGSTVFNWYNVGTGGTILYTGQTYSTSVSNTSTFYLETFNTAGCPSARTPVLVTVLPNTDIPVATANPSNVCPGENVQLSGTSANGSTIFKWYDSPAAGTLLFTGSVYNTTVNNTTTFYLETENGTGCVSSRTPVTVIVSPNLDVPTATSNPANPCPGQTVDLTASSINGSTIFNWYDAPSGGTLLYTGVVYSTTINATSNFYLESQNATGCKSTRTIVTIVPVPNLDVPVGTSNPATACPGDNVALTASSINGSTVFHWYDAPTGGNLLHTGVVYNVSVSSTTIFYLESESSNGCASVRTPVTVTILPNLDIPVATATPPTVCPNEPVVLQGTSINGSTVFNWYDVPAGGTSLFTGQTFNTSVAATSIFYVETFNTAGCPSPRTPVSVLVTPNNDVPVGTATPAAVCPGSTVDFNATSANGSLVFNWYDAPVAGTLVYTGATYTTVLNTTTVLYLESENATGCRSILTPVTAIVAANLDIPVALASPSTLCPGDSTTLTAISITGASVFNWYDAITGGNLLHTGNPWTTTFPVTSTVYVETSNGIGCSSVRTPVNIVVVPNIDVPLALASPPIICPMDSVYLTGTSVTGSTIFHWYDTIIAGTALYTGAQYGLLLSSTDIFYLETENSEGCRSIRTPVTVVVNENTDNPLALASPNIVCKGSQANIVGVTTNGSLTFNWYDSPVAGTLLFTGPIYSPTINNTALFYLETENITGCKSIRVPVAVDVSFGESPILMNSDTTICSGNSAYLHASTTTGMGSLVWYDSLTGGQVLYNGNGLNTAPLYADTTYYVEAQDSLGCPGNRQKFVVNVEDEIKLDQPVVECETQGPGKILFTWAQIGNATGYEISRDNGLNWQDNGMNNYILLSNLGANTEVTILVRGIYSGPSECTEPKGTNSESITCRSEDTDDLIIPYNTFSPNGDGTNDTWNIGTGVIKYSDNEVTIFNRLGEQVFYTQGYDNETKVFDGKGLASGSYYYVVTIPSMSFKQTGFINLTR